MTSQICECVVACFQLEDGLGNELLVDDDDDDDELKDPKSCWDSVSETLTSKVFGGPNSYEQFFHEFL